MFGDDARSRLFARCARRSLRPCRAGLHQVFLDGVPGARTARLGLCAGPGAGLLLPRHDARVPELVRWVGRCRKLSLSMKILRGQMRQ